MTVGPGNMIAGTALLLVDRVSVSYGGIAALQPLSFSVAAGDLVLVLGPNGAGKTSLLRAIAGAIPLRTGQVFVGGEDVSFVPGHRRVRYGVSLVPEGRGRLPGLTVSENLDLGWHGSAYDRRGSRDGDIKQVVNLFPRLGERMKQDCSTLSGGEMQMLAIGRALLAKPKVLLLDEPSLGLAPKAIAQVYDALGRLNASGLAMVLVEQKAVPLPARRESTIVLQSGSVVFQEDRRPSLDELTALYLGDRSQS